MPALRLGLGLVKQVRPLLSYIKDGLVADWSRWLDASTVTLEDKSPEGNDATLYTGRYISTDGSTDRGIVADCSAAGAGSYYLTGKVRPNAVTTAELTMDGSTDSGLTGLTADVWQDFTTATASVTPSAVQVGFDGTTASAADWSDVKLIDSSDGSTVARWQLTESVDGDLDGYPALDSSGNSYHGSHTGCAGGTGETDILQTAGQDWNRRMWFDGVDDYVATGFTPSTENRTIVLWALFQDVGDLWQITGVNDGSERRTYIGIGGASESYKIRVGANDNFDKLIGDGVPMNEAVQLALSLNNGEGTVYLNGSFVANITYTEKSETSSQPLYIGKNNAQTASYVKGLTFEVQYFSAALSAQEVADLYTDPNIAISSREHRWKGNGTTSADWTDQIGSNNGTVNGSPSNYLIPESDTTAGTDALGNAIAEPRVNNKVVNIFDTETVDLPDNASLETVRSVTLAVYNDGGTKDVLQAAGGASFVDIAANTLQTDQTGTHTYYVNGAATTTLAAGWNIITIVFDAGKDFSGGKIVGTSGNLLAYDPTALTSDDALQNYNAFKHQYGL